LQNSSERKWLKIFLETRKGQREDSSGAGSSSQNARRAKDSRKWRRRRSSEKRVSKREFRG
jgi:hypothetical protein